MLKVEAEDSETTEAEIEMLCSGRMDVSAQPATDGTMHWRDQQTRSLDETQVAFSAKSKYWQQIDPKVYWFTYAVVAQSAAIDARNWS